MSLVKGYNQLFTDNQINPMSYISSEAQIPIIPEGVSILTITNCQLRSNTYLQRTGKERVEIEFIDEENRTLKQVYYLGKGMMNFAKFMDDILGEVPNEEIDLNSLVSTRVKAFIYHNYLSNGKGYANIAKCELYEQKKSTEETR